MLTCLVCPDWSDSLQPTFPCFEILGLCVVNLVSQTMSHTTARKKQNKTLFRHIYIFKHTQRQMEWSKSLGGLRCRCMDTIFMNSPDKCLKRFDTVYHWGLRFITACGNCAHHCCLYAAAKWPTLCLSGESPIGYFLSRNLLLGCFFSYPRLYVQTPQPV